MRYLFAQTTDDRALRINPIVECNYRCEYCAVGLDIPRIRRAPPERWAEGFSRIPEGIFDVVSISGGEPMLLKTLPDLVNAAAKRWPVRVYTNLSRDPEPLLKQLAQSIHWRVTFHPESSLDDFLRRIRCLLSSGHVVTTVAVRGMGVDDAVWQLERHGVAVAWDDDLWGRNEKTQGLKSGLHACTNHIWLFGPDGRRYPCVRHLMEPAHPGTFLWEVDWSAEQRAITTRCDRFGDCLSCDGLIRSEVEPI